MQRWYNLSLTLPLFILFGYLQLLTIIKDVVGCLQCGTLQRNFETLELLFDFIAFNLIIFKGVGLLCCW